jgi:beta-glucanase (GH16 family)
MRRSENPPKTSEQRADDQSPSEQRLPERSDPTPDPSRRRFLRLSGASVATLGGLGVGTSSALGAQDTDGGPPNPDAWSPAFEDRFDAGSLDESGWTVGWGWGNESTASDATITPENVSVDGSGLRLRGTHDGDAVLTGGVHTRGTVEFGPGSYVEAKLRFPGRVGFHPAFWAQPTTNDWPPELDVVELAQNGSGRDDTYTSRHFMHYSVSTTPGDSSTSERVSRFYEPGDDLTENFHVYAAEWQNDRITYYVDGQEIQTWTDSTILESFRKGAPFYLKLNLDINLGGDLSESLGQANLSEQWGESFDAEWVRIWQQ